MRLWSLHPRYLDQQGICGLWREAIMARNALEDGDHSYHNHPQLERFKNNFQGDMLVKAIDFYLNEIYLESLSRGYDFDPDKISLHPDILVSTVPVTNGQLKFEINHLLVKLFEREKDKEDYDFYTELSADCYEGGIPDLHPLFYMVNGPKSHWERGELE